MNKIPLLEKLAARSLVEHDGELIFSKEKFAELIVRRVIDRIENWAEDDFGLNALAIEILDEFDMELKDEE